MPGYRGGPLGSRFCRECSIKYPPDIGMCPVHGTATSYATAPPDDNWKERSQAAQDKLSLAESRASRDIDLDCPVLSVPVTFRDGELFISSHDVIRSDIWHRLPDGS